MTKHVIVATMRDEAAMLTEWLAHHLTVGFDEIYVYTNDCRDNTREILRALGQDFPIFQFDNEPPYKAPTIQGEALRLARRNKRISNTDWIVHIDADEYVNVTLGSRKIGDLTDLHADADAIALAWKFFGNAGLSNWDPTVRSLRQFTRCERAPEIGRVSFKTIFRPQKFRSYSVHTPKLPVDPDNLKVVNTVGRDMPFSKMLTKRGSGYPIEDATLATWANACLHHYHVRPDELQRAKNARGDANGRAATKRDIGSSYYESTNRNEAEDLSILYYAQETERLLSEMRRNPDIVRYEQESIDWLLKTYR